MKNDVTDRVRERVLALIASEFETDAAFERELGLPEKTVNNWRRCRSSSFMRMLPELSELFRVNIGEIMNLPLRSDSTELSEDEISLLHLYRSARTMPEPMRNALRKTLESTIELYIATAVEQKKKGGRRKTKG